MTKHSIEVSKEVLDEYLRLKEEIKKMGGIEADDNQIVAAMIGGFFDSLEYMRNTKEHVHNHSHEHDGCCGGQSHDCKNKNEESHGCCCD